MCGSAKHQSLGSNARRGRRKLRRLSWWSDVRISLAAHFECIETAPFHFRKDPITDGPLDDDKKGHRQAEDHDRVN